MKIGDLSTLESLIRDRSDLGRQLRSITENHSADCTIGGTYQKRFMDLDLLARFNGLMVEHVQRQIDKIDKHMAQFGVVVEPDDDDPVATVVEHVGEELI